MFFSKATLRYLYQWYQQLNSIPAADGLPDGSRKPTGHALQGVDEDLQRTAGTTAEHCYYSCWPHLFLKNFKYFLIQQPCLDCANKVNPSTANFAN